MSQIGSSSGVRVAAQPLSNVYTVLLLLAAVALIVSLVFVCMTMDRNYGTILAISEEGKRNKELPDNVAKEQADFQDQLKQQDAALERFPEGIEPATDTGGQPAQPTTETPAEPAPEPAPVEPAPEPAPEPAGGTEPAPEPAGGSPGTGGAAEPSGG